VPIDQVQKFLGHLQLSTTQIYAGDQHPRAGRKLRARPGGRQPKLNPMAPTAITVPVEQDSSAARL
jgi:hypothetical protein